jgi:ABC-type transport system involved in cytochrome c biogenesis permease subunit
MGILISGFALLGATLSDSNPQITHLMPVLNSPLLSIHVSLMMISYTLIGFITIISLLSVILILFQQNNEAIQNLTSLNQLLLYPALFFMSAGIFIGAIWANVSWGNYWSWDPKETWALISMLYYSIAMHNDSLPFLRKPHLFHLYLIIGAFLILTTYFGVNYYFGGMHSYA